MMQKKAMYPHELVGKEIEVVSSTNKSLEKIQGMVVDETKETIAVRHAGKTKTLLKSAIMIKILPAGPLVAGRDIIQRSENRLKR